MMSPEWQRTNSETRRDTARTDKKNLKKERERERHRVQVSDCSWLDYSTGVIPSSLTVKCTCQGFISEPFPLHLPGE